MTQRGIEELAAEVAAEVGQSFEGFTLEQIENTSGGVKITFRWDAYHKEVTVSVYDSTVNEDEAIKQQIRDQIIGNT